MQYGVCARKSIHTGGGRCQVLGGGGLGQNGRQVVVESHLLVKHRDQQMRSVALCGQVNGILNYLPRRHGLLFIFFAIQDVR